MLPAVLHAAVIFLLNKAARRDCPRLPEIARDRHLPAQQGGTTRLPEIA